MARTIGIGHQDFEQIIQNSLFYIDKTDFIREWWENGDVVTLITRPRRFGKTLNMSMTEQFFSNRYAGRSDLFEGLSIWKTEKYRALQGTYPVISISFSDVKETNYADTRWKICQTISREYARCRYLLDWDYLTEPEKDAFRSKMLNMDVMDATMALNQLSEYLYHYFGKKVIILLDEYDTPIQEAYANGFWDELAPFTRSLFHSTFKSNPWLERSIMTGITRVSKESVFSDLNNLKVVTTTSNDYGTSFGFTENEVFSALDEYGLPDKEKVKAWYDGFTFGKWKDIYNPWSIINYLDNKKIQLYWANTSSNSLVGKLIREGKPEIKVKMEDLMNGKTLCTMIDEQFIFQQLDRQPESIWSLLLASGYLKVEKFEFNELTGETEYELKLTNREVFMMFRHMIKEWFSQYTSDYNEFIKALLIDDLESMNEYMERVATGTFSYFDTGNHPSGRAEPERFYHGFVLGLMVDLADRYCITSNRESGFGRYDIMLEPFDRKNTAYIFEFKVYDPRRDNSLEDTVNAALAQIDDKNYISLLRSKGFQTEQVKKYGFAFQGKRVLIG